MLGYATFQAAAERGSMKGMQASLPPKVLEAACRVEALLEEAQARGVVRAYRIYPSEDGLHGQATYREGVPEEALDRLEEAFLDLEDDLDLGVAVLLVPEVLTLVPSSIPL